jgi:uncharacterized membrane protein/mono/diheme cytochrome c family protein
MKAIFCSALGLVLCGRSEAQPPPTVAKAAATPRALFKQYCAKCHGTNGTGSRMRDLQPAIPDFTAASFQSGHSDVQLLVSIRDGKGTDMPAFGRRFDSVEEHGLVKHVRSFARATGDARNRPAQDSTVVLVGGPRDGPRSEETRSSGNSLEKPIEWLGKFHVAAVHFPIALLLAAGMAELLRMLTGKPAFEAASSYCLWFGTAMAFVACTLGWFRGGIRLADDSRITAMHRWLGTGTAACAVFLLGLWELNRFTRGRPAQVAFRVGLLVIAALVLVTGFLGGAIVYGLDHYSWPEGTQ